MGLRHAPEEHVPGRRAACVKELPLAKKPAAKKSPAKAENLAAVDDPDFVLHSLQEEFDKNNCQCM